MWMRFFGIILLVSVLGQPAKADPVYAYSLGVSLQNVCVPGSVVSVDGVLLNTGSAAIVFGPGAGSPFAGVSGDGQWNVLSNEFSFGDFFGQFQGISIAPGQGFQFSFGTFHAPLTQPMGTSATPGVNLGIDFTSMIEGNLLGICPGACNYDNQPTITFTLGNSASSSDPTFFQAVVVDHTPVSVPEPSFREMAGFAIIVSLVGCLCFQRRGTN